MNDGAGRRSDAPFAIEAMAARHPAAIGPVWRRLFSARAQREIKRIDKDFDGDTAEHFPGLAHYLSGARPHIYPATHHQKLAVVDDDFALIGGLDLNERRWDTPEHDRPAEETWRDVSLAVRGDYVGQVAQAAENIWNRCAKDFAADTAPRPTLANLKRPMQRPQTPQLKYQRFSVQLTESANVRGLFSFGPKTTDDSTLQTALKMIRSAEEFLYVETQYFRSKQVASALAEAAKAKPNLHLIMVLPFAPEELAFDGKRDTAMRHAEALQINAINKVRNAFGERLALLSPAKPTRRDPADKFVAYGAGIVYVHSKILIADGAEALVGSANLNDRSLLWDTEASAYWRDAARVREFFETISSSLLGEAKGPLNDAATWRSAARKNASTQPDLRKGFLLPHHTARARRFSRWAFWLPDALF